MASKEKSEHIPTAEEAKATIDLSGENVKVVGGR